MAAARLYRLTPAGKKRLGDVRSNWKTVARGVKKVLKFA
jgi:DNA-binding PadR family transcriptional regulator